MASITPWTKIFLRRTQCHCKIGVRAVLSYRESLHSNGSFSNREISSSMPTSPEDKVKAGITSKSVTISRAMRAYMERAKAHETMMKSEIAEYEIGKRHLANIMGADPDSFTQEDIDKAIEYLLPSGISDKKARPMMKHPLDVFPKRKAAEIGEDGRPLNWMYFTVIPNYYNLLYELNWKNENLKYKEDEMSKKKEELSREKQESLHQFIIRSEWISHQSMKERLLENIKEPEYNHFVVLMERLLSHPLAYLEEDFIMAQRVPFVSQSLALDLPAIEVDDDGTAHVMAESSKKHVYARVYLSKPGTGKITINGTDLSYFSNLQYREALLFPLSLTKLTGHVDFEAEVIDEYGGHTSVCVATRTALSKCLASLVDDNTRETLRVAGMLTDDPRRKERKKPGQEGARKKFTWKKR